MTPSIVVQKRFMQDPASRRLGGISSDLARLANLLKSGSGDEEMFRDLITELKCFTEWTAGDLALNLQELLLDLQHALVRWSGIKPASAAAKIIQREAAEWAEKILESSGLLERP